jgi:response regulator RpfG family c-di-GMP phosphodiesterase
MGMIGMALVRQQTHSSLIVDFNSCGDQGPDLCRQLMEAAPRIPFVVISANPSSVDKVLFLEMEVDDYMAIPFSSSTTVLCAVTSAGPQRVKLPPENWFVPLGSNRSGGGDNEAVGASGVEGHCGDLASM